MHPVRHSILVTCIITCHGNALLFAQTGNATLVSLSSAERAEEKAATKENLRVKENTVDADEFLSYSLKASPSKRSLAKLAAERGSCDEIRSIGKTMMQEENDIAEKIRPLAAKRSIYPPIKFDPNTSNEFSSLPADKSAEFDRLFVVRAIVVLEKDIEMLRRATECEDRWVRFLALERLPSVENQLAQLRFIREKSAQDK